MGAMVRVMEGWVREGSELVVMEAKGARAGLAGLLRFEQASRRGGRHEGPARAGRQPPAGDGVAAGPAPRAPAAPSRRAAQPGPTSLPTTIPQIPSSPSSLFALPNLPTTLPFLSSKMVARAFTPGVRPPLWLSLAVSQLGTLTSSPRPLSPPQVMAPLITPFDQAGDVDVAALKAQVIRVAKAGMGIVRLGPSSVLSPRACPKPRRPFRLADRSLGPSPTPFRLVPSRSSWAPTARPRT